MNDEQVIKRKRGRPPGTGHLQRAAQRKGYDGPTYAQVQAMPYEAVVAALKEFGEEPKKYTWFDDWLTLDEDNGTKRQISEEDWHRGINRNFLMGLYLRRWIDSLDDSRLLAILEESTGECMSESTRRYAVRTDLIEQVHQATWQVVNKQSTNIQESER